MLSGQTTTEEYNFISKGYKIQLESGLDDKKGYRIEELGEWGSQYDNFDRKIRFSKLIKESNGKVVGISVIMYRSDTDTDLWNFLCIPAIDSSDEIWDRSYKDFSYLVEDWEEAAQDYLWGSFRMASAVLSN